MAMLVLLNGPPASGKSTIARRLTEVRPLSLCLDVDVVRGLLGDWLRSPTEAGLAARSLAIAMARTHLEAGHDVIVPQFLGRAEFIEQLEALARGTGVAFVEIALAVDRDRSRQAFAERSATPTEAIHRDAAALVASSPSPDPLGEMFDRYDDLVERRASAHRVDVVWGDVDATVASVEALLAAAGGRPT
jgi:predicted kinase